MAEGRRYVLEMIGIPPGPNARMHHMHRAREMATWRNAAAFEAAAARAEQQWPHPLARARVLATLVHRSKRYFMDSDNAHACLVPLVNGLKGSLIVDDDPAHIVLEVRQAVGPQRGVTLEITEIVAGEGEP